LARSKTKALFSLPSAPVEFGERDLAIPGINPFDAGFSIGIQRAFDVSAIGNRDAVLFSGNRIALLIDQPDFNPRFLVGIDNDLFLVIACGRTCRFR
jgi:hypothetical protein